MSDYPVQHPLITDALIQKVHLANEEAGKREQAYPTMFRHSDAGRCGRAMGYAYIERLSVTTDELEATEPVAGAEPADLAGEWVMYLGTLIHEKLQESLRDRFGSSCEVEVKVRHGDLSSGHLDAFITGVPGIGKICYELKTKGGFGFDKAIGLNRKAYNVTQPEGPGMAAKVQGALNATADSVQADLLIIGVIGLEAVSRQLAQRVGFGDLARVMAEWHFTPAEFGPWAVAELARMEEMASVISEGVLPDRVAVGDEFQLERLDPMAARPSWKCTYCAFRTQCEWDGAGLIQIGAKTNE